MNRGSGLGRRLLLQQPACFNEAPIHESGKFRAHLAATSRMRRFNEAPIHESGKSLRVPGADEHGAGFNEAPIHESGKYMRPLEGGGMDDELQ